MEFGTFLANLRKERGILQKELAGHLNVTVATISNYETGVHFPDLHTLIRIADFFQVSTDYLLQRTRYPFSLDSLNIAFTDDYTLGEWMDMSRKLSKSAAKALLDYYELLLLRDEASIRQIQSQSRHKTP